MPLEEETVRRSTAKTMFMLAVILAPLPVLASCGVSALSGDDGSQPADARAVAEQTTSQRAVEEPVSWRGAVARAGDARARAGDRAVARAGDAVARAGVGAVARAGDVEARAEDGEENRSPDTDSEDTSRKVTLEIRGDRGTRFSGVCSIGDEERRIGGRVPESYSFKPGSKKLECEIRKDGPGALEVELAAGDDVRSVQRQTGAGSSVMRLTNSGNGAASGVSISQNQVSSNLDSSTKSR
jgi:hypothetical protein